ncbi:hypothetical protein J6590_016607 [Homalodisca vitripennis]|nr:hypothetical protein J6590_016607 [Homalodisca vitripennis]
MKVCVRLRFIEFSSIPKRIHKTSYGHIDVQSERTETGPGCICSYNLSAHCCSYEIRCSEINAEWKSVPLLVLCTCDGDVLYCCVGGSRALLVSREEVSRKVAEPLTPPPSPSTTPPSQPLCNLLNATACHGLTQFWPRVARDTACWFYATASTLICLISIIDPAPPPLRQPRPHAVLASCCSRHRLLVLRHCLYANLPRLCLISIIHSSPPPFPNKF